MRAASEGLPEGVELLSFSYRKGKSLALRGEAAEANSVYDYVTALQQSGLFAEVKPEGIVTKAGAGGALVSDFKINATLPEAAP